MRRTHLIDLAVAYFKQRGYKLEMNMSQEGISGLDRKFDLITRKGNETHPVWVRDWNRTVGVNIVINIDKSSEDAGYSSPILIADKFSDHAKAYANRRGVKLITRSEIRRSLS